MKTPLVSIIIPVYKVEKYLRNCVDSVLSQSYRNWETILVDDGSPDGCGSICDNYAEMDKRIRVIHKQNGGSSSARNAALDIIHGDYVTFLDSDDFWHVDYLNCMLHYVKQNNADIVQCGFIRGEEVSFPKIGQKEDVRVYNNHSVFTTEAAKIIVCGKLYATSLFKGLRMPEGIIHEDDWITWKLYYRAKIIVVINTFLYYYTVNPQSIMGQNRKEPNLFYFNAYKERIRFFQENSEQDLEDMSHLQLCKSLTLLYFNEMISKDQQKDILSLFRKSWDVIKRSKFISSKYKILFATFMINPKITSFVTNSLRSHLRG